MVPERVCKDAARVRVDVEPMVRAITNVVFNAVEAAGTGGRVRVTATMDRVRAVVTVEDSGPGVAPELAARMFDPFVTGKVRGVGLGLSVARKVTEAHGGTVTADRSPDLGGARFVLDFLREG
jgi:signal transduction histidine kinase